MFRLCSDVTSTEFHLSSVQHLRKRRKTRLTQSSSRGASTAGFIHDSNTNKFLMTFQRSIIFFQDFLMTESCTEEFQGFHKWYGRESGPASGRSTLWAGSVVAVPGQRQLLTLLGLEEGVGQSDGVHSGHPGVLVELRVDVEEDGHVHLLVRVQALLLKAETLWRDDRNVRLSPRTQERWREPCLRTCWTTWILLKYCPASKGTTL